MEKLMSKNALLDVKTSNVPYYNLSNERVSNKKRFSLEYRLNADSAMLG